MLSSFIVCSWDFSLQMFSDKLAILRKDQTQRKIMWCNQFHLGFIKASTHEFWLFELQPKHYNHVASSRQTGKCVILNVLREYFYISSLKNEYWLEITNNGTFSEKYVYPPEHQWEQPNRLFSVNGQKPTKRT